MMDELEKAKESIRLAEDLMSRDLMEMLDLIRMSSKEPRLQAVIVSAYKLKCKDLLNEALKS
jgi:hypothetical protein